MGGGGGELVLWAEFVNLISHRKKDLRADRSSYILSEYNKCHRPLTVYSLYSLPRFPLTNIFRLPTFVGKDRGVGTREKRGERGGGGGREKEQRQKK